MFLARKFTSFASKSLFNKQNLLQSSLKYSFSSFKGNKHNERINELNKQQLHLKSSSKKLSQRERMRIQEEKQNKTNTQVIQRELKNDSIQIPLKAIAYYFSPTNLQPTFYAELIRSCIDSLNHVALFCMNYIKMGPNEKYPYGIEKLKNVAVLIPSMLFVYFGTEMLVECAAAFVDSSEVSSSHFSLIPTLLYTVSMGVEMNVIYNNIKDALKLEGEEANQQKATILEIFKKLVNKKDPLLQAILYENAITFLSTSVPMICSIANMVYPSKVIEVLGSTIISSISIYLGIHLFKTNIQQLIGEQKIDEESLKTIIQIVRSNSLVKDISEIKAVKYGSEKFRLSAKIEFDMTKLSDKVANSILQNLQKTIYSNNYSFEQRQESLTKNAASKVVQEIQDQINNIQEAIQNVYPNCEHIDLEISHQEQEAYIPTTVEEKLNQYNINKDNKNDPELQEFEKFVFQTADRYLKKFQNSKLQQTAADASQEYFQNSQFLTNQFEEDLLLEYKLFVDDQRVEVLSDSVINTDEKRSI
ncbi:cation efflux family protein (macronuclear) [Tetrahymena thermophila SB210]|uniref:Cation efflux family protein n=1 Tax=Tetrahymena thermophila (strain SB210) TaxID=312017 RepID=Q22GF4_TETTS|nr:cation efflux family protein [Tetrahymena thermophila SB210]EAR84377.3 cation efflux family protein [Tetrahymena thermophila SB210]|eukprot:XP_001032040.3 cation efflux family protein [Tetrahymena thermophila SB210]